MTKSTTRTTKTSAVFLAAVLVAGTFALLSPSFMGGAEAYPDYGMDSKKYKSKYPSYGYDNDYKSKYPDKDKDKDKKVIVKKVKCNNININVNGLEIGDITRTTDDLTALSAAEDAEAATGQAFGNNDNGPDFNIEDNFVFVCINNNNNAGQGADGEAEDCEDCINQALNRGQQNVANNRLAEDPVTISTGAEIDSLAALCEAIETNGVTEEDVRDVLEFALPGGPNSQGKQNRIDAVVDCLNDLGLLEEEENGISPPTPGTT